MLANHDVMLGLQRLVAMFDVRMDDLYYFKPIASFALPGVSETDKFEIVDDYIEREFSCDRTDIWTICTPTEPVILMPALPLRRAGVKLPPWQPNRPSRRNGKSRGIALVS